MEIFMTLLSVNASFIAYFLLPKRSLMFSLEWMLNGPCRYLLHAKVAKVSYCIQIFSVIVFIMFSSDNTVYV